MNKDQQSTDSVKADSPPATGSVWVSGKTGMGTFDGSIHRVTRKGDPGEYNEGWSTAFAASGDRMLLQVHDRFGNVVRIPMDDLDAWALRLHLGYVVGEMKDRAKVDTPKCQAGSEIQRLHEINVRMSRWAIHNDGRMCQRCGKWLDPLEACGCSSSPND